MAKQIRGTDIIEKDHLSNAIKSADELLKTYKALDDQIIKTAKDLKKVVVKGSGSSAKDIKQLTTALNESQIAKKASLKIDKEKQNLEVKLKGLNSEKIKQNDILKRQVADQTKTNKAWAESQRKLVGTEEKLLATNKKLRLERKKLDTTTKTGVKRLKQINAQLDRNNAILEKNSDKLKKQRLGIGRYGKAVQGLRSGLAQLGLAFGVFTLIKDSFNIIKNFDQAQADLSSVLGVTREQMSALTEQAKELGATTKFTASQVSELQIEYAKLGFTQTEIQNVTEATLQLAAAAGTDLANAAAITGSTLRAFGLDSTETQRVVDVMAKSFSSSSLDIEKFKVAMASVAPAAAAIGLTIEETTALLGTLTNAGIDASTAGTGLRNMFLAAKEQGITLDEALEQINNSSDKLGTSFDLFGKRGATLGVVLAENTTEAATLTETLNNAGGAAEEMANKQLDTLGGALDLLRSAWEGFILQLNEGSGAGAFLKDVIKFLAENLVTLVSIVIKVVSVMGVYKLATKAATVANKIFGDGLAKNSKKFGIWGAAIAAVLLLISSIVTKLTNAVTVGDLLNDTIDRANELIAVERDKLQLLGIELLNTTTASEEREAVINRINAEYGTTLQNLEDEAEFVKQVGEAYQVLVAQLSKKIRLQVIEEEILSATKKLREAERILKKTAEEGIGFFGLEELAKAGDDVPKFTKEIKILTDELIKLQQEGVAPISTLTEEAEEVVTKVKKTSKKVVDLKKKELDALLKLQELQALKLENLLIDQGKTQEEITEELQLQRAGFLLDQLILIRRLYGDETILFQKTLLEFNNLTKDAAKDAALDVIGAAKDVEKAMGGLSDGINKDAEDAEKERIKQLKKFRDESLSIVKEITDGISKNIDKRIDERQREIDESKQEVERLKTLASQGNVEAAKSIKAEQVAQAKEKLEIERLEKKKRNLLITVVALERASQLIGSGDGNPFKNASSQLSDFFAGLPKASEGTDYSVAQTFGQAQKTGVDGHLAWVDKDEKILSRDNSKKLSGMHQDEVTRRALSFDNNAVSAKAISVSEYKSMTDKNIVNKLDSVEKAIKNIRIVQQHIDLSTGKEKIVDGSKITFNNHKPSTFRI